MPDTYSRMVEEIDRITDLETLVQIRRAVDDRHERVRKAVMKRPTQYSTVEFRAGKSSYRGVIKRITGDMAAIETEKGGYFPQVPVGALKVVPSLVAV